jgi:predicted ATPase/DNA-binding CsgD family transcriptional regulator
MARPRRRLGNVPSETTSFVGRRREQAELRNALAKARLVTLVGPGGVGKTRLAMRAARDLGRGFAEGAWWVELAEIRDATLVVGAVVAALDLRDQAEAEPLGILVSYLRDREALLVLDNCEHVLDVAAELVTSILRSAPDIRIVATSREPLQASGERIVAVPPLELPSADDEQPVARLLQNEAVSLFVERSAAASGSFVLSASNRAAVVGVCRRLDGLPLAIELAAVRMRVLTVEQVLERLTDRFALLTGGGRAALPRQQTLRTTIDWSHDLLPQSEQRLLRRLCVFAGRFTVEDVEPVWAIDGGAGADALDVLAALVDKSLVIREDAAGVACYRLHETMREYAGLKLREAGEVETLDEVYVEHYRTRSRELRAALLRDLQAAQVDGPRRDRTTEWLQWLDLEIDNVRSALQKCLAAGDWRRGLELATSVGYYWVTRGTTESIRWFDDLLAAADGSAEVPARAFYFRGWLSMLKGHPASAVPWLTRAIASARAAEQLPQLSESLSLCSTAQTMAGDRVEARRLLDEATVVTADLDHYPATMALLQARATYALLEGDLAVARDASAEGTRRSRGIGDLYYLQRMLMNLGLVAVAEGDPSVAKARFVEGLRVATQTDDRLGQSAFLRQLGALAVETGQARLGAQLLGAGEALGTAAGVATVGPVEPWLERARAAAVAAMGAPRFDADHAVGARWPRERAIRHALGETETVGVDPGLVDAGQHADTGPLSRREVEVARLIAEGLGNREIGARLFISERTVTTHVTNILNKLGFDSRSRIASWVSASGH